MSSDLQDLALNTLGLTSVLFGIKEAQVRARLNITYAIERKVKSNFELH